MRVQEIDGSPACAGIDPILCLVTSYLCGLPRVRGDRPVAPLLSACPRAGSPACAGIDLSRRFRPARS